MKILLLLLPVLSFASGSGNDYDIVPRTINFVIFAGIIYYLIAEPIKNAYKGRINAVAKRLENIQDKLKISKNQKQEALLAVKNAENNASELIKIAQKEAENLAAKIKLDAQNEILYLEKLFEEQKFFEERKVVRTAVSEILDELFDGQNLQINQNEFMNLVIKKVS